jgi:hypothetical protein
MLSNPKVTQAHPTAGPCLEHVAATAGATTSWLGEHVTGGEGRPPASR